MTNLRYENNIGGCHRLNKEGNYIEKKVIGLDGQGGLTEAATDSLQNYHGNAIRKNVGDVGKMKDAVWAI